ncbi:phosphatase RsbU N-terminal domain-containing protein [Nakamurella sp. GG22]
MLGDGGDISSPLDRLTANYVPALLAYLNNPDERRRNVAYELGRGALTDGITLLDLIGAHHAALAHVVGGLDAETQRRMHDDAATFLSEALAPYEMARRGFLDRTHEDPEPS